MRVFGKLGRIQKMMVGIESNRKIKSETIHVHKITGFDPDSGIKGELFLCKLHHPTGNIDSFNFTRAVIQ